MKEIKNLLDKIVYKNQEYLDDNFFLVNYVENYPNYLGCCIHNNRIWVETHFDKVNSKYSFELYGYAKNRIGKYSFYKKNLLSITDNRNIESVVNEMFSLLRDKYDILIQILDSYKIYLDTKQRLSKYLK